LNIQTNVKTADNFVDVSQIESGSFKAWVVCLSVALFFFYDFIQMMMCNSLSVSLMRDFSIDATKLGYLSSSFLLSDVLFLFPAGLILDRVSIRKVTVLMLSLSIIGTFGLAMTTSFQMACAFRFIAGIAHAFCFLCCILLAARWFPPKKQAFVIGIIITIAMLGGLVAQTPLSLLSDSIGWRNALLYNTVLGLGVLFLVWWNVSDSPKDQEQSNKEYRKELSEMGFLKSLSCALSNVQNWFYGIYTGLLNLPIMLLGALWGVLYLTQVHNVPHTKATMITSMIYIGTIVGAPVMGWISDVLMMRRLPMIIGAMLSLVVFVSIIHGPHWSVSSLLILFFVLGFVTSAQVISYPAIGESNPKAVSGTSMGLASCLIMGLGGASQPFTGWLLDKNWDGTMVNGIPYYTQHTFNLALSTITVGIVIGLIMSFLVKETFSKTSKSS